MFARDGGKIFVVALAALTTAAVATIRPGTVLRDVFPGETLSVVKTITADQIGGAVVPLDICFVQDATGSFDGQRCADIRNSIPVIETLPGTGDVRYGLKTFKDYSDGPSQVYESRLTDDTLGALNTTYQDLCNEPPRGGGDAKEAQYDAIARAIGPGPGDCGWREGARRIMIAVHDAGCKGPAFGPEYINTRASVRAALLLENVVFIGVTVGGVSTNCFQPFATATGGDIVRLGDSAGLGASVGAIVGAAAFSISPVFSRQCELLNITYEPTFPWHLREGESVTFTETLTVLADRSTFVNCNVLFPPLVKFQRVRLNVQSGFCGNGIVDDGEQCDEESESCDPDCTCARGFFFFRRGRICRSRCGNNRVERFAGEECDGSPFCLDTCQCRENFTPRGKRCRCVGGRLVGRDCILTE